MLTCFTLGTCLQDRGCFITVQIPATVFLLTFSCPRSFSLSARAVSMSPGPAILLMLLTYVGLSLFGRLERCILAMFWAWVMASCIQLSIVHLISFNALHIEVFERPLLKSNARQCRIWRGTHISLHGRTYITRGIIIAKRNCDS
jgi:hypothetical protein